MGKVTRKRILAEVAASMSFEGMPLKRADKKLLNQCVGRSKSFYKKMRQSVVAKHSSYRY
jgi:hypothetical protein